MLASKREKAVSGLQGWKPTIWTLSSMMSLSQTCAASPSPSRCSAMASSWSDWRCLLISTGVMRSR